MHAYTHMCIYVCVYIHICMYTYTHMCIHIYIYMHKYIYIYISSATARRNNPHSQLAFACTRQQLTYWSEDAFADSLKTIPHKLSQKPSHECPHYLVNSLWSAFWFKKTPRGIVSSFVARIVSRIVFWIVEASRIA